MTGAIEARGHALGEARAAAQRTAIAARINAEVPGVRAGVNSDGVTIEGRRLLRRWLNDARLRTSVGGGA